MSGFKVGDLRVGDRVRIIDDRTDNGRRCLREMGTVRGFGRESKYVNVQIDGMTDTRHADGFFAFAADQLAVVEPLVPRRIRLSRQKGWRLADHVRDNGCVIVDRRSKWGNWYVARRNRIATDRGFEDKGTHWVVVRVDKWGSEDGSQWGVWATKAEATAFAVMLHRAALEATYVDLDGTLHREFYLGELRGHDLACWCEIEDGSGTRCPCHADTLLVLSNPGVVFPWTV